MWRIPVPPLVISQKLPWPNLPRTGPPRQAPHRRSPAGAATSENHHASPGLCFHPWGNQVESELIDRTVSESCQRRCPDTNFQRSGTADFQVKMEALYFRMRPGVTLNFRGLTIFCRYGHQITNRIRDDQCLSIMRDAYPMPPSGTPWQACGRVTDLLNGSMIGTRPWLLSSRTCLYRRRPSLAYAKEKQLPLSRESSGLAMTKSQGASRLQL
jgi:hypothetical protein